MKKLKLIPTSNMWLWSNAGDVERFTRLFRQAWKRVPLWARRKILARYREIWPPGCGVNMTVQLIDWLSDWNRGDSGDAIAQCNSMLNLSFRSSWCDNATDHELEETIAHELAHAYLFSIHAESHSGPINSFDAHVDVFELLMDWGFDGSMVDVFQAA